MNTETLERSHVSGPSAVERRVGPWPAQAPVAAGPMIQHWPSVGLPGDACLQKMEVFAKRQQPGYT